MTNFPSLSRRQLLSSAATIAVAGTAPNIPYEAHARSEIAQEAKALAPPSKRWIVQRRGRDVKRRR
jgi:hypothetical protein